MLTITVGLGIWQVERLAWKTALLAGLDRVQARPPVPLPARPEPFERVVVEGRFLPQHAFYGSEVRTGANGAVLGAQLLGVLERSTAAPIIVDRGWAPFNAPPDTPSGPQQIEGYVRLPERASWVGVRDDPVQRQFFALDPEIIGRAMGLADVAPYTIVALGNAPGFPQPATSLPRPPNDHLSYAATWFSLSIALMIVFGCFVRQTLRREIA